MQNLKLNVGSVQKIVADSPFSGILTKSGKVYLWSNASGDLIEINDSDKDLKFRDLALKGNNHLAVGIDQLVY